MQINSNRKATKCKTLITDLNSTYPDIKFVNLSMNALEIFGFPFDSLLSMFKDFNLDQNQNCIIKKVVSVAIRCTYYAFCRRNKSWPNPELLDFTYFIHYFPFYYLTFLLAVFHCKFSSSLCRRR